MSKKPLPIRSIRIRSDNLKTYKKTASSWRQIKKAFPQIFAVVKLFKAENQFDMLLDKSNPKFLKGFLSKEGLARGARIPLLPNGEKLEKAFSLFSPFLKIHDQSSHDHWDVLYQNPGGTWSYVYTLKKRKAHLARKYKKVDEFEKRYPLLLKKVKKNLNDKNDIMALPMFTLLNTYMRVGNETYFKAQGHRGLTTLTKKNISIKGNTVTFKYHGKCGVPRKISQVFPKSYVNRLNSTLKHLKKDSFVFSKNQHCLHDRDFKKAFLAYCGTEFYPHIVRSFHATLVVKNFLSEKQTFTKKDVEELYLSIAHDLGHKKFNKKKNIWEEHYTVTVNSYIQPELVSKINKKISKKS